MAFCLLHVVGGECFVVAEAIGVAPDLKRRSCLEDALVTWAVSTDWRPVQQLTVLLLNMIVASGIADRRHLPHVVIDELVLNAASLCLDGLAARGSFRVVF